MNVNALPHSLIYATSVLLRLLNLPLPLHLPPLPLPLLLESPH
jgi:hypothetical protein